MNTLIQKLEEAPIILADPLGKLMFSDERTQIIHMELKPYQKIKYHYNTHDVIFFVVQGEGFVEIEEKTQKVEKNTSVFIKGGLLRAWSNKSQENLILMVVKLMTENKASSHTKTKTNG
jgi:quercetin dioxygenase-like cupin family protein